MPTGTARMPVKTSRTIATQTHGGRSTGRAPVVSSTCMARLRASAEARALHGRAPANVHGGADGTRGRVPSVTRRRAGRPGDRRPDSDGRRPGAASSGVARVGGVAGRSVAPADAWALVCQASSACSIHGGSRNARGSPWPVAKRP